MSPTPTTAPVDDRLAITDVLHTYAAALDEADADLLASVLTEDAVVDLTPATRRLGMEFPVLAPREVVVDALMTYVGPLDTSHSLSNLRFDVQGDRAEVRCHAAGQHFLPGEGADPAATRHALMGGRYRAQLRREEGRWRLAHLEIDLAWFEGDPLVLVSQG